MLYLNIFITYTFLFLLFKSDNCMNIVIFRIHSFHIKVQSIQHSEVVTLVRIILITYISVNTIINTSGYHTKAEI